MTVQVILERADGQHDHALTTTSYDLSADQLPAVGDFVHVNEQIAYPVEARIWSLGEDGGPTCTLALDYLRPKNRA